MWSGISPRLDLGRPSSILAPYRPPSSQRRLCRLGGIIFQRLQSLPLPGVAACCVVRVQGEASLQNLLEMACTSLRAVPEYGNREVPQQ